MGWNDGKTESYAYTEIDGTAEFGADLRGKKWKRPQDKFGAAFVVNGISPGHREYLALGGLGFILGDGGLTYSPEKIFETYYTAHLWRGISIAGDFQHISDPGYNSDRGPAQVSSIHASTSKTDLLPLKRGSRNRRIPALRLQIRPETADKRTMSIDHMGRRLRAPGLRSILLVVLLGLSATSTLFGIQAMLVFDHTPGAVRAIPAAWPSSSTIKRPVNRPELLVFVHPFCSCTFATVRELAQLRRDTSQAWLPPHRHSSIAPGIQDRSAERSLERSAAAAAGSAYPLGRRRCRGAKIWRSHASGHALLYNSRETCWWRTWAGSAV